MEESQVVTYCSECDDPIHDKQIYMSDRRVPGYFCSTECCNKAVEDAGAGWDNYQAWKD